MTYTLRIEQNAPNPDGSTGIYYSQLTYDQYLRIMNIALELDHFRETKKMVERRRMKGYVAKAAHKLGEFSANLQCKIYPKNYEKYLPTLTCYCCGKTFKYRGLKDAAGISGLQFDFETGEWVATSGEPVYCDDCLTIFSGGAYNEKTQYEVINGKG